MLRINQTIFSQVVAEARTAVATREDADKWLRAIDKAVILVSSGRVLDYVDGVLLVVSSNGSTVYRANGRCQCMAYVNGQTHCQHRVLAKLVRQHNERRAKDIARIEREMEEVFSF